MLICPSCGADDSTVKDSRPREDGCIRRRRKCQACGAGWTTLEVMADDVRLNIDGSVMEALEEAKNALKETIRSVERAEVFYGQRRMKMDRKDERKTG